MRNELHTAHYQYVNNLLDPESDKTSKSFWKYVKSRKQDSVGIGTLKADEQIAETARDKAKIPNNQFCSVFTKENLENQPVKGPSSFPTMPNINVTLNGVIKCIQRLNPQKVSGPDKIPIIVLKETVNEISPVLKNIFQHSLDTADIPSDWKNANIVPIFKKGDRTKPANYHPVSLTAVVSKMIEHIVVSQVMDHLDGNNIITEYQYGFRSKRSCES